MSDEARTDPLVVSATDAESLTASLSERCRGRLVLFAARRLRGDRASAEDVVQDAFRTVLQALRAGRIPDSAALPAFAYETVRHLCLHRGRSAGREATAMGRFAELPEVAPDDALTGVISDERRRAVRDALGRLDKDDRRVLEMTYMETQTSDEIGRVLGLTPVAVRARRLRALRRLSALLGVTFPAGREER